MIICEVNFMQNIVFKTHQRAAI